MTLPDLPRQLDKKEANVTRRVMKWIAKNWPRSAGIEIKIEDGKLADHQIESLQKVQRGKFVYKIPDMGRKNPFDAIFLKNADALIVRVYNKKNCVLLHNGHETRFTI